MGDGLVEPVEVVFVAVGDFEGDDFGGIVGVTGVEKRFELGIGNAGGFDESEGFMVGLDGLIPSVYGFDGGDDIDAGGELILDEKCANLTRYIGIGEGGEDEKRLWSVHGVVIIGRNRDEGEDGIC